MSGVPSACVRVSCVPTLPGSAMTPMNPVATFDGVATVTVSMPRPGARSRRLFVAGSMLGSKGWLGRRFEFSEWSGRREDDAPSTNPPVEFNYRLE